MKDGFNGCKFINPDKTEIYIIVKAKQPFCCMEHVREAIKEILDSNKLASAEEMIGMLMEVHPKIVKKIMTDQDPRTH